MIEGGIKRSIRQQRKVLEKEKQIDLVTEAGKGYDILHLNLSDPISIYQMFRAKRSGKKVIFHTHVTEEDFRDSFKFSNKLAPIVGRISDFVYSKADLLIAPSDYTKRILEQRGIETKIKVLTNGIDTERLEGKNQSKSRLEKEFETNGFHAVNLGMILERKGLEDFIKVGEKVDENLLWFGSTGGKIAAKRKTKKLVENSPENVKFPGYLEDVRDAFTLADVFFFPTREENQGISLLEAAYREKPLVVRDIEVYEDLLEHEVNCLKADSVDGFAKQLERLRDNEELRGKIGENARETAEKHTLQNVGNKLLEIYVDLDGDTIK
ncbi:MAG: glycosyltransferase [Nanohaloarchaea archaeon SW_7_43_1]|nr:MAG: glycosyltransferase [Nanohaloarchaea archaeon SW_7_43_1]